VSTAAVYGGCVRRLSTAAVYGGKFPDVNQNSDSDGSQTGDCLVTQDQNYSVILVIPM
jgi:hypothetical protein